MIPVNTPVIGEFEKKLVAECLETGWISSEGPFVERFEREFTSYIGKRFGIAVSSGSAALDIALNAIGLKDGDEVIMPTFTIISPALSIVRQKATPVLIDSDPDTWNIDVSRIEGKITNKTKAILVVHIYGLPTDMDPIIELANRHGLPIIEDAAEMHGQTYNGKKCGSFGDLSIFSFYPNKHITTGEGGMVLTNSEKLAEKCRKLRNLSFDPKKRRFIHDSIGWNYRMTNMQAALGIGQLSRIDEIVSRKRRIGALYNELLEGLNNFQKPIDETSYAKNIYWIYGLVGETEELTKSMILMLTRNKIGTRPFFWCMHEQPVFKKMGLFKNEHYPVAERIARNGFYIPSGLGLQDQEIEEVAESLLSQNGNL